MPKYSAWYTRDYYPSCVRQAKTCVMRCCCASDTWHVTVPAVLMNEPPRGWLAEDNIGLGNHSSWGSSSPSCTSKRAHRPHLHQQFGEAEGTL